MYAAYFEEERNIYERLYTLPIFTLCAINGKLEEMKFKRLFVAYKDFKVNYGGRILVVIETRLGRRIQNINLTLKRY